LLRRHESEDLFGVQLAGSRPSTMVQCAELVSDRVDCDFIDLNLGCPIDLIFRKVPRWHGRPHTGGL
jgi:tRNA-dihydrouridine synthase 3